MIDWMTIKSIVEQLSLKFRGWFCYVPSSGRNYKDPGSIGVPATAPAFAEEPWQEQ